MNKHLFFSLVGATALISFTACQSDELLGSVADGQETTVTFTAQLPGAMTRTYGQAESINILHYAVYSNGEAIIDGSTAVEGNSANVSVDLVKGQKYDIFFWAQDENSNAYTFNGNSVAINYGEDSTAGCDDSRDAFYAAKTSFTATGVQESVVLYRPFAQLNLGTNDYAKVKDHFAIETVEVTAEVYSNIDLATGEALDDQTQTITFTAALPAEGESFPIEGYDYLSMNYLFVGSASTSTVTFKAKSDAKEVGNSFAEVPLKANCRTNIAGKLLTSTQDFDITIDSEFGGSLSQPWDGETVSMPTANVDAATGEVSYTISSADQLAGFAALVNGTFPTTRATASDVAWEKAHFVLESDIDLGGKEWAPIARTKWFQGTFDGNGHTISNLKISREKTLDNDNNNQGLFSFVWGAEIKNFTLHNVDITGAACVGAVIAQGRSNEKIDNIRLTGKVNIAGATYVGGLTGYHVRYASNIVIDVEPGSKVSSDCGSNDYAAYVGGVAGHTNDGEGVFENIQSNIDVEGNSVHVGGISGIAYAGHIFNNCHVTGNVSKTGNPTGYDLESTVNSGKYFDKRTVGGIVGTWINGANAKTVTVTNCSFKGQLSNGEDGLYAHGLALIGSPYNQQAATTNLVIDYNLATAQQLQLLASAVNDTKESFLAQGTKDMPKSFAGETINLVADVDLSGIADWMPIGINSATFKGTFNGNGHAIKNMTIVDNQAYPSGVYDKGFFGFVENVTVKDVTFDNATINNGADKGNIQGIVAARARFNTTFENVRVLNSYNRGFGKLGAIAGYADQNGDYTLTFKGCSVSNTTISGKYNMGGLIGVVEQKLNPEETQINVVYEDCDVNASFNCIANDSEITTYEGNSYWVYTGNLEKYGNEYFPISAKYYCSRITDYYPTDENGDNIIFENGYKLKLDGYCINE